MRTFKWHLETGINGGDLKGEVFVEDSATPEEIEYEVREDMWNWLSLTWEEVPQPAPAKQGADRRRHSPADSS